MTYPACHGGEWGRREGPRPTVLLHSFGSIIFGRQYKVSYKGKCKGKAVPLQAWSGPQGSRKLRFPDFMTTAQGGGKFVRFTHRPHLPPGNSPGTHFFYRLSLPQGYSAIGSNMSAKNSNDTTWNRTSDLSVCSTAL